MNSIWNQFASACGRSAFVDGVNPLDDLNDDNREGGHASGESRGPAVDDADIPDENRGDGEPPPVRGPPYHVLPFKNEIRSIMSTDDGVFTDATVTGLAALFAGDDFPAGAPRAIRKNSARWRPIADSIQTLLVKFDDTRHNVAYFSGCLVCVFREVAGMSAIPPGELKTKLAVFVEGVRPFVHYFDCGLWENWFLCIDWFYLLASVFMPNGNFVRANDRIIIGAAMAFLNLVVKRRRYKINENIREPSPQRPRTHT